MSSTYPSLFDSFLALVVRICREAAQTGQTVKGRIVAVSGDEGPAAGGVVKRVVPRPGRAVGVRTRLERDGLNRERSRRQRSEGEGLGEHIDLGRARKTTRKRFKRGIC